MTAGHAGSLTEPASRIVSGPCVPALLHIARKVRQNALEIHSAADDLDTTRDFAVRGQLAANDSVRNSSTTGWLTPPSPKYCHVW